MLKRIRAFLVPTLILTGNAVAAAWTIASLNAPPPTFRAAPVIIIAARVR